MFFGIQEVRENEISLIVQFSGCTTEMHIDTRIEAMEKKMALDMLGLRYL